jgi:hypothetical protein
MESDISDANNAVNSILSQLKGLDKTRKDKNTTVIEKLTPEQLEQFVIDKSQELVLKSLEVFDEFKDVLSASPDAESAEAISQLMGASTAAIDSLSKVLNSNKRIASSEKLKLLDIETRKELNKNDNKTKIMLSRKELLNLLLDPAAIDIESTAVQGQKLLVEAADNW